MIKKNVFTLTLIGVSLMGCGGGTAPNAPVISGTLLIPDNASTKQSIVFQPQFRAENELKCPTVPAGYLPLVGSTVGFVDAGGLVIKEITKSTDECGGFSLPVPTKAARIKAVTPGYKDLIAQVGGFQSSDPKENIASTIAEDANYIIGSIQKIDDANVAFTVTDDQTNKAVIGIPDDAFGASLNSSSVSLKTSAVSSSSEAASVVLSLDASGSMGSRAFTDETTGISYSRYQVASIAAHTFLNVKSQSDEVSAIIFDGDEVFIDKAAIDTLFKMEDEQGNEYTLTYPADGFSTDVKPLRFTIDAYNRKAEWWRSGGDALHPDTPKVVMKDYYPWGGSTAFIDSIGLGIEKLRGRSNPRKFILAMTDGRENASQLDESQAIELAKQNNISIYTIGFGSGTDETSLRNIAQQTGGTFFLANDTDLTTAYQSIQTNIRYQYVGNLNSPLGEKFILEIYMNYNGQTASRELNTL